MGGIFGKKKEKEKKKTNINTLNEKDKALMDCKMCRDKIKDYIKRMEKAAEKKKAKAKELLNQKDKERAKIYLKQHKFHLAQIKASEGQLEMVEEQIGNLENAFEMAEAAKVLQNGNKVLKDMQSEMNIEKWEEIKEDMTDIKEQQDEIGEFLKSQAIDAEGFDKSVEDEYNQILKDMGMEEAQLPDAVKSEPEGPIEVKNEEEKVAIEA